MAQNNAPPQQMQQMPQYPQGLPGYQPLPYNPVLHLQQRLAQYEQNNPQLAQQLAQMGYNPQMMAMAPQQMPMQQMPQQSPPSLKGRAVTCIDEVKAITPDFDGSVSIFTDYGNGKIYTKQLTDNGTSAINTYVLIREEPKPDVATINYDTKMLEMSKAIEAMTAQMAAIQSQMEVTRNEHNGFNANASRKRKSHGDVAADGGEQPDSCASS